MDRVSIAKNQMDNKQAKTRSFVAVNLFFLFLSCRLYNVV